MSNAFGLPDHLGNRSSCIVCLTGTDTVLGFRGDINWVAGGLAALGVPVEQAIATVENTDIPVDQFGQMEAVFQVCAECSGKANMPKPALVYGGASIPTLEQVGGESA